MHSKFKWSTKVKKHALATNEASDGKRPPRSAADSGRLVSLASARRLSLLRFLGWADAAPKAHAGSSDGDTAIELLSEVVTWMVLIWFGRQRGMKNWVCEGPVFFQSAADSLGGAKDRRRSRCDGSGGPTSRNHGLSTLKQPTTPHEFAWPSSVTWNMPSRWRNFQIE